MSGLYIEPYKPNALDDDDQEARAKHLLAQLERNWDRSVRELEQFAHNWSHRFARYEERCHRALQNREQLGFNEIGELQGNVDRFDVLCKQISDLEEMLVSIRKILYAEEKKPVVRSSGATNRPRRRNAAGKKD